MELVELEGAAWINAVRLKRVEGSPVRLTEFDIKGHPGLVEAFREADEEHLRVSTQYPEMAYDLIVKPISVGVQPSEAKAVAELLSCTKTDAGRYGSRMVLFGEACYRVSIVMDLCG